MADTIAALILAVQYALVIFIIDLSFATALPLIVVIGIFIFFAAVAIAIWHAKKDKTPAEWGILALSSVSIGILFFGVDWLNAYLGGYSSPFHIPGGEGPLGLTLTALVCPCATMVCVGGCIRAFYIVRIGNPTRS